MSDKDGQEAEKLKPPGDNVERDPLFNWITWKKKEEFRLIRDRARVQMMKKYKPIRLRYEKAKKGGDPVFDNLYHLIRWFENHKNQYDWKAAMRIMTDNNIKPYQHITKKQQIYDCYYIILKPVDFKGIENMLDLRKVTIEYYIREMVRRGLLKLIGGGGKKHRQIYAVGYVLHYSYYGKGKDSIEGKELFEQYKTCYFIKLTPEIRKSLIEFDPFQEQRKS